MVDRRRVSSGRKDVDEEERMITLTSVFFTCDISDWGQLKFMS